MKAGVLTGALALVLAAVSCGIGKEAPAASAVPAAESGKKIIGAKLTIKAEKVDEFVALAKTIIAASRAEAGNISYTLYQDPYERTTFFFFEEWKNQAAIDAHFAMPHFKAFGEKMKDLAAGPASITIYDCPCEKKP